MSSRLRFRFDAARVEPILRDLASLRQKEPTAPDPVAAALERRLSSWPGVILARVWAPGKPHTPLGSHHLRRVSKTGVPFHCIDQRTTGTVIPKPDARGVGAYPLGTEPPFGVLLVLTRVPLEPEAFWWLGRLADHAAVAWIRLSGEPRPARLQRPEEPAILTQAEFKDFERRNLTRALKETQGRIFGSTGAAALLGMKPTTLASRIKALGIEKDSAHESKEAPTHPATDPPVSPATGVRP